MAVKRNAFTYIVGFVYLLLTFGVIYKTAYGFSNKLGTSGDLVYLISGFAMIIIVAVFCMLIAHVIYKIPRKSAQINKDSQNFLEGMYILVGIVLTIMIRVIYLIMGSGRLSGNDLFYNCASKGITIKAIDSDIVSSLYIQLLNFLFDCFGTHVYIISYFNVVLHTIIFICLYFVVKNIIGRMPGVVASGLFVVCPYFYKNVTTANPTLIITTLIFLSLVFLSAGCKRYNNASSKKNKFSTLIIIAGVICGICGFIDISGILLLLSSILLICMSYNKEMNNDAIHPAYLSLSFLWSFLISFVLCFFIETFPNGESIGNLVSHEYQLRFDLLDIKYDIIAPLYESYEAGILVGLSVLLLMRIFVSNRDYASSIILFGILLQVLNILNVTIVDYELLLSVFWCIFSAIGVAALSNLKYEDVKDLIGAKNIIKQEIKDAKLAEKEEIKAKIMEENMAAKKVLESANKPKEAVENKTVLEPVPELDFLKDKKVDSIEKDAVNDTEPSNENRIFSAEELDNIGVQPLDEDVPVLDFLHKEIENEVVKNEEVKLEQATKAPEVSLSSSGDDTEENKDAIEPNKIVDDKESIKENGNSSGTVLMNPALKYGRRMDYKTAVVKQANTIIDINAKQTTPVKPIHNPLPTPKKPVMKDMDFDYVPSSMDMHFDVVDLKGIDFFDIN